MSLPTPVRWRVGYDSATSDEHDLMEARRPGRVRLFQTAHPSRQEPGVGGTTVTGVETRAERMKHVRVQLWTAAPGQRA